MTEAVPEPPAAAAHAMHEVVRSLARERALEPVLTRIVHSAGELVAARYAAIGVPDGLGGFAKFLYTGVTDEQAADIGALPRVSQGEAIAAIYCTDKASGTTFNSPRTALASRAAGRG